MPGMPGMVVCWPGLPSSPYLRLIYYIVPYKIYNNTVCVHIGKKIKKLLFVCIYIFISIYLIKFELIQLYIFQNILIPSSIYIYIHVSFLLSIKNCTI